MKAENRKKLLLIEDNPIDAELIQVYLEGGDTDEQYIFHIAPTGRKGLELYDSLRPDCVIVDFGLPDINGLEVLKKAAEQDGLTQCPFVFLTGYGSEDVAVAAMKAGAMDYLNKKHLDTELFQRTIRYAVNQHKMLMERENYIQELQAATARVKKLERLLSICASCKKIRNDSGDWEAIELYIAQYIDAEFTHGICPECYEKEYAHIVKLPYVETDRKAKLPRTQA